MHPTFRARALRACALSAVFAATSAHAALGLENYTLSGSYALDALQGTSGGISGYEASAVTYARDRGTLFFVGDEGTGVVEISRTGQTLGSMGFDWSGSGSTKHDTEGLAYLGNGQFVVTEERLFDAYRFTYANQGSARLADAGVSISNATVGNSGLEGIAYDPRQGSYIAIKQESPQAVLAGSLSFGPSLGGTATMSPLFDPAGLGVSTLSDVATLAGVDHLAGSPDADHLLILSLGSQRLLEVDRSGAVLGSLDLSGLAPHNAIEGVTVDERGIIYLVAEQEQDGSTLVPYSRLLTLAPAAAVPEPATATLSLLGLLAMAGIGARRRSSRAV